MWLSVLPTRPNLKGFVPSFCSWRSPSFRAVLAIPHNGNLSNGLMFDVKTYSGGRLTKAYADRRMQFEPIYEVTQQKGDGEAHPLLSPDDQFADFETMDSGNLNGSTAKTESYWEKGRT